VCSVQAYTDNSSNVLGSGHGLSMSGFRIRGEVTDLAGDRPHVLKVDAVGSDSRSAGQMMLRPPASGGTTRSEAFVSC
jgi:hypothetical protein